MRNRFSINDDFEMENKSDLFDDYMPTTANTNHHGSRPSSSSY
jgi:hypothetical protein